jgi:hypothetical protein
MIPMDLQDRAQYLSLALFSQAVVSALMEYVDENKTGRLKDSLGEALHSLVHTGSASVSSQRGAAAFSSYEHLRTRDEVWSETDRANAIKKIRRVLNAPRNPRTKPVANELIELFSRLQAQALWNFEQPRPVSPKVMQRLCKLA